MKLAIHQLHYFPWPGYLHKMANSDAFLLLDTVQLTDNSYMFRHKLLTNNGEEKYITIPFTKKHYLERPFKDLEINNDVLWQKRQMNFIKENYKKAPYFDEIWERISFVFEKEYKCLFEVTYDSILILREIFGIDTPLLLQSSFAVTEGQKTELVIELCKMANADVYYSGNGARKYMQLDEFEKAGIQVEYQKFQQPRYPQFSSIDFIGGLSSLDMLFNCGIKKSKELFWNITT